MEDQNNHIKDIKNSLKKLMDLHNKTLKTIKEKEPEMFKKISIDTAKIEKSIKNQDFEALLKLQKQYANNSDK